MRSRKPSAGEIVSLAGLEGIAIGETLADPANPVALPTIKVEEPTVRMTFGVNTSPFSGREGKWGTSRKLRERLFDELRTNVALRVEETELGRDVPRLRARRTASGHPDRDHAPRRLRVPGLAARRSSFTRPKTASLLEPYEEVHIETSTETVGVVVEMLGARRGQMMDMHDTGQGMTRLAYIAPTRGLLGFRYQFLTSTRGAGVMHTVFHGYDEMAGPMATRSTGSIVAMEAGDDHGLRAEVRRRARHAVLWARAWRCTRAWWLARTAAGGISPSTSAARST